MSATSKNNIAGTWQLVAAQLDPQGANTPLFGAEPAGLLVFTADLHFVELLHNPAVPGFAANDRTRGWRLKTKPPSPAA